MGESCSCEACGVRKNLSVSCEENEVIEYRLIKTRNTCARQAMQIQAIPQGVSQEDINVFVKASIEALADAVLMEQLWWEKMLNKYKIKEIEPVKPIYIDLESKEFYILEG